MIPILAARALAAPFSWDPVADSAITGATGVTWAVLYFSVEPTLAPRPFGTRVPGGIDAVALGRWNPGLALASDLTLYGMIPITIGIAAVDGKRDGDLLTPALLLVETWAVTGIAVEALKNAVGRPRPYVWIADPPADLREELETADATYSFPSGHTAFAGALSFGTATLLVNSGELHPGVAYGVAGALTAGMGVLRVGAGKHYPTDVIAGAALGVGVGLAVPTLHQVEAATLSVTPAGVEVTLPW